MRPMRLEISSWRTLFLVPCCMLNRLFEVWLGSLTGVYALGSRRTLQWERERCINEPPGMTCRHASRSKLWTPRDLDCSRPGRCWGIGIQNWSANSDWRSVNCVMKFGEGSPSTDWQAVYTPRRCVPRPSSFRRKLSRELTDGERRIWLTHRCRPSQHSPVSGDM